MPVDCLSAVVLLFGALHWWQAFTQGRVSVPVTALLNALLIWRVLLATPRTQPLDAPAS